MTEPLEAQAKARVASFLPEAISKTLEAYHSFSQSEQTPEEAKEFSAHHAACKVAISHLELLIKLAKWAGVMETKDEQEALTILLSESEEEVSRYYNKQEEE